MEPARGPAPTLSDAQLVRSAAADDIDALVELVSRHSDTTFAVALLCGGTADIAAAGAARAFAEIVADAAFGARPSEPVAADLVARAREATFAAPLDSDPAAHQVPDDLRRLLPIERVVVWLTRIGWAESAVATAVAVSPAEVQAVLAIQTAAPSPPAEPTTWWD